MRKITTSIMAITMAGLMAVAMVGCGTTAKNNGTGSEATTQASAESTTEYWETGEDNGSQVADYYKQILEDVYATKAGSAGSSSRVEAAAQELRTFAADYAEDISLQNMEELAMEDLTSMQENYGEDFVANFQEEFEEVVEEAKSQDKNMETDVAFNQVVNATTNQLDAMK